MFYLSWIVLHFICVLICRYSMVVYPTKIFGLFPYSQGSILLTSTSSQGKYNKSCGSDNLAGFEQFTFVCGSKYLSHCTISCHLECFVSVRIFALHFSYKPNIAFMSIQKINSTMLLISCILIVSNFVIKLCCSNFCKQQAKQDPAFQADKSHSLCSDRRHLNHAMSPFVCWQKMCYLEVSDYIAITKNPITFF